MPRIETIIAIVNAYHDSAPSAKNPRRPALLVTLGELRPTNARGHVGALPAQGRPSVAQP